MDMPWVTVGTVIGVAATVAIAWINQKTLNQRELLREEIRTRETLYGEFVGECARLLVDAFQQRSRNPSRCCRRMPCSLASGCAHRRRCLPRPNVSSAVSRTSSSPATSRPRNSTSSRVLRRRIH